MAQSPKACQNCRPLLAHSLAPFVGAGSLVNTHRIKQNQKDSLKQPVITVKKGNINQYGHEVEIPGGCRVVYRPDRPMCGARVWIESLYEVRVIDLEGIDFKPK